MKTRASLLAELEEKRRKNNKIELNLKVDSPFTAETDAGYDPYDNPSLGKEVNDPAEIAARRRRILERRSRR